MADEANTNVTACADSGTVTESQQQQTQQPPEKSYTESEYQKMSTGQYAAGLAAAMKEAGFEATKGEDFKKQMKAFREWQDTQKSDLEKANGAVESVTKERDDARAELALAQKRFAAIGKGVSAEKADKYVRLAESYLDEGGDFDKALDAAIADFPLEQKQAPPPYAANTGTAPLMGGADPDEFQKRINKYRRN